MNEEKVSQWSWCLNPGLEAPGPTVPPFAHSWGRRWGCDFHPRSASLDSLLPDPATLAPPTPIPAPPAPSLLQAGSTLHGANRHLGPAAAALMALQLGSGTRARLTQGQNLASAATRPEGMEMRNSWSPPLRLAPHPAFLRAHHLGCYRFPACVLAASLTLCWSQRILLHYKAE